MCIGRSPIGRMLAQENSGPAIQIRAEQARIGVITIILGAHGLTGKSKPSLKRPAEVDSVLAIPPVKTTADAVRAAIVAD